MCAFSEGRVQATNGTLPSVTFLRPGGDDGHPGYSTLAAFENFTAGAIAAVQNNPAEWKSTAIFVTFDESRGYYDSGYIQPVSFFGDVPRVPMIVVSPDARRGVVDHTYDDHVLVSEVHRGQLETAPADQLQRGQPAERDTSGRQSEDDGVQGQPHARPHHRAVDADVLQVRPEQQFQLA